jgi:hypothetical protein
MFWNSRSSTPSSGTWAYAALPLWVVEILTQDLLFAKTPRTEAFLDCTGALCSHNSRSPRGLLSWLLSLQGQRWTVLHMFLLGGFTALVVFTWSLLLK